MDDKNEIAIRTEMQPAPEFDTQEYQAAVLRILEHKQSEIKFRSILSSATNAVLTGDYSLGRISHNYFSNCSFQSASLERVSGAGSIFENVQFNETNLQNSNFQNSTFEHCLFEKCNLNGCNLGQSYFSDVSWVKISPYTYNASGSYYKDCTFTSSKPGNLSEACLDTVVFDSVRLTNLNMEYSSFRNIQSQDLILPFSQMPYIFNGLQYVLNTSDNVRVSSHINKTNSISVNEYVESLNDMIVFFSYRQEYFPLANILLAFERYGEALNIILKGIIASVLQCDFRMCKYLCKLLTDNGHFGKKTLHDFYYRLNSTIQNNELTEAEYFQLTQQMPEIRSMLIDNPERYPCALLTLKSQNLSLESEQVKLILVCIDEVIHLQGASLANQSISVRHNSPLEFIISLYGTPLCILAIASFILKIFANVCKGYNEFAQALINHQTIAGNRRQKELDNLEKEKITKEIEKLKLENIDLQERIERSQDKITGSGIIIANADLLPQDFNPTRYLLNR